MFSRLFTLLPIAVLVSLVAAAPCGECECSGCEGSTNPPPPSGGGGGGSPPPSGGGGSPPPSGGGGNPPPSGGGGGGSPPPSGGGGGSSNPPSGGGSTTINQCNTGPNYCCNNSFDNNTGFGGTLGGGLVGVVAQLGLTCNPISVIGIGGNSCSQQPACCDNVQQNGLINVACSPINLTL